MLTIELYKYTQTKMATEGEGKNRIGLFVSQEFRKWIKFAAEQAGQTQNEFIVQAVYDQIKVTLQEGLIELFKTEIIPPAGKQKKQEPESEEVEDCNE